jgi:aminoglycoside phosphotransferase (APT) family kinase protein
VPAWTPEIAVDEGMAHDLIAEQFPQLQIGSMRLLGVGWDMTVWLVDDSVCFRFPRKKIVVPGLMREMQLLPVLGPLLPLPISLPVFRGVPADSYPWPFAGGYFISGTEICDANLDDRRRAALANPLATFLRRLHSNEVLNRINDVLALPMDPLGRADMRRRVPWAREALGKVEQLRLWKSSSAAERCLEEAERLGPPTETVLVHGDLHLRHLLVDNDNAAGVIDWVDMCMGSRSLDLTLYWSLLPADGRAAFVEIYGPVGHDDLLRARVLAFGLSAVLASYGRQEGLHSLELEAAAGLERAASG